ncbi:putative isoflavone reductase [Cocos nucifera]|uniref:Putative isoflavone reductase n=1 Tax=Cocos nucifera TaxID=13894 RepID=A0A8K0HW54_COCNU|nr:putative isoflavone reductase [Cocos nucifera]
MPRKAFLAFTSDLAEVSSYLFRVAYVKVYGRSVKEDDVTVTLSRKACIVGSWKMKKLSKSNTFFIVCPSNEVVQALVALGHIMGEDLA